MQKRSLTIVFVVVTLLFSAWGNVIAAAFCPRFALNRDYCLKHATQAKQVKQGSSCHHEMAGMEMDDDTHLGSKADSAPDSNAQTSPAELTSESLSEQVALDLPIEPCAHCVSHSQTTSGTVSAVAIDPSKRLVESNALPANFAVGPTAVFADFIVPSEHGPPGPSNLRHLIINVFRI